MLHSVAHRHTWEGSGEREIKSWEKYAHVRYICKRKSSQKTIQKGKEIQKNIVIWMAQQVKPWHSTETGSLVVVVCIGHRRFLELTLIREKEREKCNEFILSSGMSMPNVFFPTLELELKAVHICFRVQISKGDPTCIPVCLKMSCVYLKNSAILFSVQGKGGDLEEYVCKKYAHILGFCLKPCKKQLLKLEVNKSKNWIHYFWIQDKNMKV